MVGEQGGFEFDPQRHHQPPPIVHQLRPDGLAAPARPAPPPPSPQPVPPGEAARQRLFTEPVRDVNPQYVAMARAVSQILATRLLLLIAVLTASGVWAFTIYDPLQLRIIAASSFSLLGVAPLIWLYHRKG